MKTVSLPAARREPCPGDIHAEGTGARAKVLKRYEGVLPGAPTNLTRTL